MVIGIISDTHGYFHPAIAAAFKGVDLILHAGDVGTPAILDALETIAPTDAVYGNVDGAEIRMRTREFQAVEAAGLHILMTHIAGKPGRWNAKVRDRLTNDVPDVFVYGHSHILRIDRDRDVGNVLCINPGAAGRQGMHQVKTVVRLIVADGQPKEAQVVHLDEASSE